MILCGAATEIICLFVERDGNETQIRKRRVARPLVSDLSVTTMSEMLMEVSFCLTVNDMRSKELFEGSDF
jgi:hypothetical protein